MAKPLPNSMNNKLIRLIERGANMARLEEKLGSSKERIEATIDTFEPPIKRKLLDRLKVNENLADIVKAEEAKAKAEAAPKSIDREMTGLLAKDEELKKAYEERLEKERQLHVSLDEEIQKVKTFLLGLRECQKLLREADAVGKEMDGILQEHQEIQARLEEIRRQRKVTVLVYQDGSVTVSKGEKQLPPPSFKGWENKVKEIVADESGDFEALTIWEVKLLSKLLVFREAEDYPDEIEFILDNGIRTLEAYL